MLKDLFKKAKYISIPLAQRIVNELGENPQDEPFITCIKCEKKVNADKYEVMQKVCPNCGNHTRLTAIERILYTVDADSFEERYNNLQTVNPLDFEGYIEKIEKLQKINGIDEAVVTGYAKIHGYKCALGVMDSNFLMASMGSVVGEKLSRLFENAAADRLPVVIFTASGGARMHEGIISLMQMAKVSAAVARHSDAGLLYITVLCDPTTGGVTASFASLGDIIIAEPAATVGFAGRRVIEGTIGYKLPENFQSAEFLLEHGFVDIIIPRYNLKKKISLLFKFNNLKESE